MLYMSLVEALDLRGCSPARGVNLFSMSDEPGASTTLARSVRVGCTNVRLAPDKSAGTVPFPCLTDRESERETLDIIAIEGGGAKKTRARWSISFLQSHD